MLENHILTFHPNFNYWITLLTFPEFFRTQTSSHKNWDWCCQVRLQLQVTVLLAVSCVGLLRLLSWRTLFPQSWAFVWIWDLAGNSGGNTLLRTGPKMQKVIISKALLLTQKTKILCMVSDLQPCRHNQTAPTVWLCDRVQWQNNGTQFLTCSATSGNLFRLCGSYIPFIKVSF